MKTPSSKEVENFCIRAVLQNRENLDLAHNLGITQDYFSEKIYYKIWPLIQKTDRITILSEELAGAMNWTMSQSATFLGKMYSEYTGISMVHPTFCLLESQYLSRHVSLKESEIKKLAGKISARELSEKYNEIAEFISQVEDNRAQDSENWSKGVIQHLEGFDMEDKARPWPFTWCNENIPPISGGQQIAIVGSSGSGKTSLGIQLMDLTQPCLIISSELDKWEYAVRILLTKEPSFSINDFVDIDTVLQHDDEFKAKLRSYLNWLDNSPVEFVKIPDLNLPAVESAIRRIPNLNCVMIDHVNTISGDDMTATTADKIQKFANRMQEISKELDFTSFMLAQTKRLNSPRLPVLDDIKNSSGIGDASQTVMFIHKDDEGRKFVIRKNRYGQNDIFNDIDYIGPRLIFSDSNNTNPF